MARSLPEEDRVTRDDIPADEVLGLPDDIILKLFTMRVSAYSAEHNLSRDRVIERVSTEFRDDYRVNVPRILDERNYMNPSGHKWNVDPFTGEEIRLFDPVTTGEMVEGGPADFRPGDIVILDGGYFLILASDCRYTVGMDPGRTLSKHPTAVLRQLFEDDDTDVRLVRSGEVVRENDEHLGE